MEENQKKKKRIPTIVWWVLAIVLCAGFFLGPTVVANIKEERYKKQVTEIEAVKEVWLQGMIHHDVEVLKKVFPRDKFHEKYGEQSQGKSDEAFYFDEFTLGADFKETFISKDEDGWDEITIYEDKKNEEFASVMLTIRFGDSTQIYGCNLHLNMSRDSEGNVYIANLGISNMWKITPED